MRSIFVMVLVAGLLGACKSKNKDTDSVNNTGTTTTTTTTTEHEARGWDKDTRAHFVTNCTNESKTRMDEEAAREYCQCMLEKIVAKYPTPAEANNMTIQQTQDMARECVK
jgi:hypothetical protein